MVKTGMTRRLDPLNQVRELGNASGPPQGGARPKSMICGRPRRELFLAACRPYSAIGFTQVSEWLSQYVSSAGCGQRAYPPFLSGAGCFGPVSASRAQSLASWQRREVRGTIGAGRTCHAGFVPGSGAGRG